MNTYTEENPLNSYIQSVMSDTTMTPQERAAECVEMIEYAARAEFGLDPDVRLTVPAEWEHRIPLEHRIAHHAAPIEPLILEKVSHDYLDESGDMKYPYVAPKKWWQR
jgi:hypothetical protein